MDILFKCSKCGAGYVADSGRLFSPKCALCRTPANPSDDLAEFNCPWCNHTLSSSAKCSYDSFYCPHCHKALVVPEIKKRMFGMFNSAETPLKVEAKKKRPTEIFGRLPWIHSVLSMLDSGMLNKPVKLESIFGEGLISAAHVHEIIGPDGKDIGNPAAIAFYVGEMGYHLAYGGGIIEDVVLAGRNKPASYYSGFDWMSIEDEGQHVDFKSRVQQLTVHGRPWCYPATIMFGAMILWKMSNPDGSDDEESESGSGPDSLLVHPFYDRVSDQLSALIRQSLTSA